MVTIKLNDEEYYIKENIEDLRLIEYCKLISIYQRRERKLELTTVDGEEIYELLSIQDETEEFKLQKERDILNIISDIPNEYYDEYPELIDEVFSVVGDLITDDSKVWKSKTIEGIKWKYPELINWTFQEWCDMEGAIQMIEQYTILAPFIMILRKDKQKYNRFHTDFQEKINIFGNLPAKGNVSTMLYIINEMKPMRAAHPFIYEVSVGDEIGRNLKEHLERVKWEDTIVQLAQTNVFNSNKGTLNGVRNTNVLDVLQYLNIKKSRDTAEYLDYKKQNTIQNNITEE